MKHIISLMLENEPGALSRVVGLFSARGYNIESLTVAPTEDLSLSRMTIQTHGSDDVIEQITKHLNRLIEVVKVVDLTEGAYTERELMLVKRARRWLLLMRQSWLAKKMMRTLTHLLRITSSTAYQHNVNRRKAWKTTLNFHQWVMAQTSG